MCAHAVRVAVGKIDGVQRVVVSLNEGYADITLAADNAITVQLVRDLVRKNGFTPREAHVRIRGTVTSRAGALTFEVLGGGESFRVVGNEDTLAELTASGGETVTVVGVVPEPSEGDPVATLRVTDVGGVEGEPAAATHR